MNTFEKLTPAQRKEIKNGVIEVTGKAMNRTALGVVDAIFTLYPNIRFNELKEMLPDTINPSAPKNYKSLFKPYTDRLYGVVQSGSIRKECEKEGLDINASHFTGIDETFKTSDGVEVLVSRTWESADTSTGENDLQNLISHVAQHGVRVTKVESKVAFNKGTYNLEIINPVLMKVIQSPPTKKFPWWIVVLLIIVVGGVIFFLPKDKSVEENTDVSEAEVSIAEVPATEDNEPIVVTTIADIKTEIESGVNTEGKSVNFHQILFELDSDVILSESEIYLSEILNILNEIPELKLLVVGHTSSEGDDGYNLKLSIKRALAVVQYLGTKGVDLARFEVEGKGSSEPIATNENEEGKKLNRRIEFVVIDDGVKNI